MGGNSGDFVCFHAHKATSEMESTVKGKNLLPKESILKEKNLLPVGANSFLIE